MVSNSRNKFTKPGNGNFAHPCRIYAIFIAYDYEESVAILLLMEPSLINLGNVEMVGIPTILVSLLPQCEEKSFPGSQQATF